MHVRTTAPRRVTLTRPQAVANTSAVVWSPESAPTGPVLVLGHGAGTDMTNPVLRAVGRGLSARGCPVVAFNFGYVEAGRRAPDPATRLESCFRDVVGAVRTWFDDRPVVLGGRSMGCRIASRIVAQGERSQGLVLLGYPLHPAVAAGRTVPRERLRTGHWPGIHVPLLFVQGDRDRLCHLDVLERELPKLPNDAPATVHVVAGADHGFAVPKSARRGDAEVFDEIVATVAGWLDGMAEGP